MAFYQIALGTRRFAARPLQRSVARYQKFYATIRIVKKYRDTRYYRDT